MTRNSYLRAAAVVEVVAETGSRMEQPGLMRVLRVYKGNMRVGTRLAVRGVAGSMCGHGDFRAGSRGIIIVGQLRGPIYFQGYMTGPELARLRAAGLMPSR